MIALIDSTTAHLNRPIYHTKSGGWPEKAVNPSPHANPTSPHQHWGPNSNIDH